MRCTEYIVQNASGEDKCRELCNFLDLFVAQHSLQVAVTYSGWAYRALCVSLPYYGFHRSFPEKVFRRIRKGKLIISSATTGLHYTGRYDCNGDSGSV